MLDLEQGKDMVSIHAPVKVRHQEDEEFARLLGFNSRTCEGATEKLQKSTYRKPVSIHAPVKVRRETGEKAYKYLTFQFTHL